MPRPNVVYSDFFPYHITARSNNREWFDVPLPYCFGVFSNVLLECKKRYEVKTHAFVLMNNHFHWLVTTPQKNVGEVLRYFMTETSRGIGKKSQRINHIYGGRNHKQNIHDPIYYAHCLKYILRNPVVAGICDSVENYRWSSHYKHSNKIGDVSVPAEKFFLDFLPEKRSELLNWLNEALPRELLEQCRKAARRQRFEFKPSRRGQKKFNASDTLPPQKVPGT